MVGVLVRDKKPSAGRYSDGRPFWSGRARRIPSADLPPAQKEGSFLALHEPTRRDVRRPGGAQPSALHRGQPRARHRHTPNVGPTAGKT
jgi:hypothetical protein